MSGGGRRKFRSTSTLVPALLAAVLGAGAAQLVSTTGRSDAPSERRGGSVPTAPSSASQAQQSGSSGGALEASKQGAPVSDVGSWSPQPPRYSEGSLLDQPVVMSDRTVLRADVYYPADVRTGAPASGPFPVLLQQTPYGKRNVASSSAVSTTDVSYLVDRGYIVVISDVRGTGDSGGTWGLFDPVQDTDGATVVDWASRLPHSDGEVGLFGESYMGINQFLTVAALDKHSPVKAMFPIISGNDLYRDTVTQGGLLDAEFSSFFLALVGALNGANPLIGAVENAEARQSSSVTAAPGTVPVELAHSASLLQYDLPAVLSFETGGDQAYDQSYWGQRSPVNILSNVVADGIPAFLVGGWNDLFQRGELLNYTGLQNAYAGRPVLSPMTPNQPVTPRYQLMMGPWQHVTTGAGVDLTRIELEWFDTWLLGQDTPLAHSADPLHLYALSADRWIDTDRWPVPQAQATQYFLGPPRTGTDPLSLNDGTLSTARSQSSDGNEALVFQGASSPCDLQTDQWSAGLIALASQTSRVPNPCDEDDVSLSAGPGALTYTTAPATIPEILAGPIDATVYATSNTSDVELVATIEEVSPGGDSVPITSGALLGSFRQLDRSNSWYGGDGEPLLPYHPYSSASTEPVVHGELTRYDVEVFPTFAEVPTGWRLRVTLTTADSPHLEPSLVQLPNLVGGVYEIHEGGEQSSFVNLPLASPSLLAGSCSICH